MTVTTATRASHVPEGPGPGPEGSSGACAVDADVAAAAPCPLVTCPAVTAATRAVTPEATVVPGLGASGGLAVRAPGAVLEGVLVGVPVGVPGPGAGEVLASSVFGESAPGPKAMDISAPAIAPGTGGSEPGETCALAASGEASSVSTTTVLLVTVEAGAAAGAEVWASPGTQAGSASPGATRVTGADVAVVTGGPGATTTTGPALEPRGGGEGAAGAP